MYGGAPDNPSKNKTTMAENQVDDDNGTTPTNKPTPVNMTDTLPDLTPYVAPVSSEEKSNTSQENNQPQQPDDDPSKETTTKDNSATDS